MARRRIRPSAFSLFHLRTTRSATFLSVKTNSAMTVGRLDMSRQVFRVLMPSASSECWEKADSMSAAVVPGAKLEAVTLNGPEAPLILRPDPFFFEVIFASR